MVFSIVGALLLSAALGYLLGSIPFGLVLTRAFGLGDIRKIGSGNIGATNVLRTGNKGLAAATLLLDGLKGTAAVLLVPALVFRLIPLPAEWASTPLSTYSILLTAVGTLYAAGLGAFLGHLFPVWLKFKGGKGVAVYIGVLAGLLWPAALVFCMVWLVIAITTRYSSAAALVASVAAPPATWILGGGTAPATLLAVMSALLIWKHSDNIKRLRAGTESRIGAKG